MQAARVTLRTMAVELGSNTEAECDQINLQG